MFSTSLNLAESEAGNIGVQLVWVVRCNSVVVLCLFKYRVSGGYFVSCQLEVTFQLTSEGLSIVFLKNYDTHHTNIHHVTMNSGATVEKDNRSFSGPKCGFAVCFRILELISRRCTCMCVLVIISLSDVIRKALSAVRALLYYPVFLMNVCTLFIHEFYIFFVVCE